jgi:hypothetical protein
MLCLKEIVMMSFSDALENIKSGKLLQRQGWNGKDMFIFLVPGSTFNVNRLPLLGIYPPGTEINYHAHIDMKTANGQVVPWLASQTDLLADDWQLCVNRS